MADAHRKRPQPDDPQPSTSRQVTTSLSHRSRPRPGQATDRKEFSNAAAAAVPAGNASDDDDYTSSAGSDSSEEESDNDGEEEQSDDEHDQVKSDDGRGALPRIPARHKPRIQHVEKDADLLARISAFLPQMKNANDELQREIEAGRAKEIRVDEVDDQEGQYIEMNLGLGVLEEKRQGDDSDNASDENPTKETAAETNPESRTDSNVLGKLMGQEKASSPNKPTIEEMKE